jgi:ribulose-phosphate 3-epimerase
MECLPLVAPSILTADLGRVAVEVRAATAAGGDWLHVDVMDGHFVPPITIGPLVVEALRPATTIPLDVHLMIESPERQIESFARAGADGLTVHVETCRDPRDVLRRIREAGLRAGLALNPPTPIATVEPWLDAIDVLLVMSVNPGWGGQAFIPDALAKVETARRWKSERNATFVIEVDGGVKPDNASQITAAGAEVLVAGSAIFASADYAATIRAIRG